jgi:hypothetical protein
LAGAEDDTQRQGRASANLRPAVVQGCDQIRYRILAKLAQGDRSIFAYYGIFILKGIAEQWDGERSEVRGRVHDALARSSELPSERAKYDSAGERDEDNSGKVGQASHVCAVV